MSVLPEAVTSLGCNRLEVRGNAVGFILPIRLKRTITEAEFAAAVWHVRPAAGLTLDVAHADLVQGTDQARPPPYSIAPRWCSGACILAWPKVSRDAVCSRAVRHYIKTAVTNALDHETDISKVQEWLGYANIATTRLYDRRRMRPEDSPTFKVAY